LEIATFSFFMFQFSSAAAIIAKYPAIPCERRSKSIVCESVGSFTGKLDKPISPLKNVPGLVW
jgi:hypothetical protein